jgi:hypothetical protein
MSNEIQSPFGPPFTERFTAEDKEETIAALIADGEKPSKQFIRVLDLMMQLTPEERTRLSDWMNWQDLIKATPEERREILSTMDACPCCGRWMGHNNPPADDDAGGPSYRRQASFDSDR